MQFPTSNDLRCFLDAVWHDNLESVQEQVRLHPNVVRSQNKNRQTGLHIVCQTGNGGLYTNRMRKKLAIVGLLIKKGASLHKQDIKGRSPLHVASFYGGLEVARLLVHYGANVDARDKKGLTPLHLAAGNNDLAFISFLLEHNVDIDALSYNGRSPLYIASFERKFDTVRLLISSGADCWIPSEDGTLPLYWAAFAEQLSFVMLFLEAGVPVYEETISLFSMKFFYLDLDWQKIRREAGRRRFVALEHRETDSLPPLPTDLNLLIISYLSDAWNTKAIQETVLVAHVDFNSLK